MIMTLNPPKTPRPVTPLGIAAQELEKAVALAVDTQAAAALTASLQEIHTLVKGLDPYLETCTTSASPALTALAQRTATEDWSKCFSDQATVAQLEQEMLSGHLEGQFLKLLVQMAKATRILEVGMFTGYSALAMAEALPDDGELIACELDDYVSRFAQECFEASPHGHKITVKVAPALETLQQLAADNQVFDLVFIDADKPGYVNYFQLILDQGLLAPGGFILVDNTLLQGQPYLPSEQRTTNGEAIAQFNQFVADDPRVDQVLLPVRDGFTMIRRK